MGRLKVVELWQIFLACRDHLSKEEASSLPVATTESVFFTVVMNAHKSNIIGVRDISGAFLQANMDEFVVVKFEDKMVEIKIKIEPKYEQFVHVIVKGKRILYVQLRKAMYSCMRASRLWWKDLSP